MSPSTPNSPDQGPAPPRETQAPPKPGSSWLSRARASLRRNFDFLPNCHEVVRLTSDERERDLPVITRWRIALHRTFCPWCARYARQLDLLHRALAEAFRPDRGQPKEVLPPEAKARWKAALSNASVGDQRESRP
jgi:hypothetical protein